MSRVRPATDAQREHRDDSARSFTDAVNEKDWILNAQFTPGDEFGDVEVMIPLDPKEHSGDCPIDLDRLNELASDYGFELHSEMIESGSNREVTLRKGFQFRDYNMFY